MCCFSREVERVGSTRIFGRSSKDGRQLLAYEMFYIANEDLSMILPLPVPAGSKPDAVRFISLKDYPEFFGDLSKIAPPKPGPLTGAALLDVQQVGAFEASFVPSIKDFARLDERFRLPEGTWDALPVYKDYGFAVFKLKKDWYQPKHPMAFEFPRRDPKKLFFPTVHIHDGKIHPKAHFDHRLFCQKLEDDAFAVTEWLESPGLPKGTIKSDKDGGLVDPERHVYRLELAGERDNVDFVI
jgi:hypothetical protein